MKFPNVSSTQGESHSRCLLQTSFEKLFLEKAKYATTNLMNPSTSSLATGC